MLEESGKLQLITRAEELHDESAVLGDMATELDIPVCQQIPL